MTAFDPDAPADPDSGLFGLDCTPDEARVHVFPVPFDATASYRKGAARAPLAVLRASHQIDLYDAVTKRPYEAGIWMAPIEERVERWNEEATAHKERADDVQAELNDWLYRATKASLAEGKLACVLGGDHSVPFGAIRAHAETKPGLGILHVDAHADLREAYEGYTWSHASILYNVVTRLDAVGTVAQVGIRDLCEAELDRIGASEGRIRTMFDHEWARARLAGEDLTALARRVIDPLPRDVYVTFDVDGLDPALCPNTGTPVPGGLTWSEAMLLLGELVTSGRRIVGFDVNEVAPAAGSNGEGWDEIVGARLLYRLIGFALASGA